MKPNVLDLEQIYTNLHNLIIYNLSSEVEFDRFVCWICESKLSQVIIVFNTIIKVQFLTLTDFPARNNSDGWNSKRAMEKCLHVSLGLLVVVDESCEVGKLGIGSINVTIRNVSSVEVHVVCRSLVIFKDQVTFIIANDDVLGDVCSCNDSKTSSIDERICNFQFRWCEPAHFIRTTENRPSLLVLTLKKPFQLADLTVGIARFGIKYQKILPKFHHCALELFKSCKLGCTRFQLLSDINIVTSTNSNGWKPENLPNETVKLRAEPDLPAKNFPSNFGFISNLIPW